MSTTEYAVGTLDLDDIAETEGFNPRTTVADSNNFDQLVESVKLHGVLTPILVRPDGTDKWKIVAGHRRYAAAKAAGMTSIPVSQTDATEQQAKALAIIENIHREDLTPLEEAHAFKTLLDSGTGKEEIAGAVSKTVDYINGRLRLLNLPMVAQEAVGEGKLPLGAIPLLARIAEVSPALAEAVTKIALYEGDDADLADDFTPSYLLEAPHEFVECVSSMQDHSYEWEADVPDLGDAYAVRARGNHRKDTFTSLPAPHGEKVAVAAAEVPDSWLIDGPWTFNADDSDAARAWGCLLEFDTGNDNTVRYFTDPEWVADRVVMKVERWLQEHPDGTVTAMKSKADSRGASEQKKQDATPAADSRTAEEIEAAQKAERREQLDREKADREKARNANLELGRKMAAKLHEPKITKDNMKLVAAFVIDHFGADLLLRGLRYVDESMQEEVRKKDGGLSKVMYLDKVEEAEERMWQLIEKAKNPEQIMGVLLRAMVATRFANQGAVTQSQARYFELPGSHYSSEGALDEFVIPAIEKIGKVMLPASIKESFAAEQRKRDVRTTVSGNRTLRFDGGTGGLYLDDEAAAGQALSKGVDEGLVMEAFHLNEDAFDRDELLAEFEEAKAHEEKRLAELAANLQAASEVAQAAA